MTTMQWSRSLWGEELTAVLYLIGDDCAVILTGGQKEHIGAVSVCTGEEENPFFAGTGIPSGTDPGEIPPEGEGSGGERPPAASGPELHTLTMTGHKEQFITEVWCRRIHRLTGGTVSVLAGVHYDHLTKEQIARVMFETDVMLEEVLSYLRGRC